MKKIESFQVDHLKLKRGIYVSRRDSVGKETVTTFDIRMTTPNLEPVMNTAEIHAIEHLGATFLRSHPLFSEKTVYFGPMGCRTGFYLILCGAFGTPREIMPLMVEMFQFIADFAGAVPGASAIECGNYLDINLPMANYQAKRYLREVLEKITPEQMEYQVSSLG